MNHPTSDLPDESSATRCPACDRPSAAGTRFCPGCGRGLVASATSATSVISATPATPGTSATPVMSGVGETATTGPVSVPAVRAAVATAEAETRTRTCPGCGAPNDPARILCGACGLDLESGDPHLTVEPFPSDFGGWPTPISVGDEGPSTHRWWVPVLAILLVVGGVVATIVGLELGPFAPSTEIPDAPFAAERYPGEAEWLTLTDVATVTFRAPDGARTFTPEHLVDDDPTTAWHGDRARLPEGTDEKIDLFLDQPAWVDALVVDNGDQLDAEAYAASARVQRAVLVFDGEVRVPVTLLDQGLAPQIVELDEPILTTSVRLEVVGVVPGTERGDVAISRMELRGHPADDQDLPVAEERAEALPAAGVIVLSG